MTDAVVSSPGAGRDPYRLGRPHGHGGGHGHGNHPPSAEGHGEGGPASKRIIVGYGFWLFLLSDFVMFSGFFAAYAVLSGAVADGPTGRQIFDLNNVAIETGALLLSSFACGMASLAVEQESALWTQVSLLVTGLLGLVFLVLEVKEFADLIARGDGPGRSAFLSSFFALVGCHGLHITCGLLWLGTTMAQLFFKGFTPSQERRFLCFSLFWHALDIIWVAIFSLVYLLGSVR
jgi:cytochrome o ubiquinol oxidase subunit III